MKSDGILDERRSESKAAESASAPEGSAHDSGRADGYWLKSDGVLVHVHCPQPRKVKTRMLACPTCQKRRKMLTEFFEWYGWDVTCLTCGERWMDGEMCKRPFMPKWRQKNVEAARKRLAALAEPRHD